MRPLFVAGCERSGTTLLAAMLAGQRGTIAPPEAQFLLEGLAASRRAGNADLSAFAIAVRDSWRYRLWGLPRELPERLSAGSSRPAEVMEGLVRAYAERAGSEGALQWIDHTPTNIGYAPTLLAEFGDAQMVHLLRDPRAVVASLLPLDWGPSSARAAARWWLSRIALGLAAEAAFPDRVARVRYEHLVRDPGGCLEWLCARVGLSFERGRAEAGSHRLPAYTQAQHSLVGLAPDASRIDAWRSALSPRQISTIEGELGDMPAMLGYDAAGPSPAVAEDGSAREFLASTLLAGRQRLRRRRRMRRALKHPEWPAL